MSMYSVNSESLTSIADEIRGKTGLTDELTLEQMMIDAASLPGRLSDVPVYVQAEAERVAGLVKALQNENTLSFIAVSDVHVGSDAQSRASALHAAQGAKIISKLVPIDFTAVLGDVVSGSAADTYTVHIDNLMQSLRTTAIADPALRLSGNHDANIYNADCYQTAEDVYRFTGRFSRSVKPATEVERNYFYFDLTEKKTRVICLNTADLKDIPAIDSNGNAGNKDGHHISAAQFEWFISALDMTGKTGWRVIVLSHHPLHWYGSMPNVLTLLDAYVVGASGSITADSASISYDFAGKNAAKLIGTIHGHTHNLIHGKTGTVEIIRMGTPNACFGRNNEYGSADYGGEFAEKYGEATTYSKTANSAKDTAFCVYTIDFADEVVYATCYGAGYDRTMSYEAATFYTVSNNLTNLTSSNTATLTEAGAAYSATLTANDGYSIKSVRVTMGGVDVTVDVYKDGVITIQEVTGELQITAVASAPVRNLVTTSLALDLNGGYNGGLGYKNGVYASSSSVMDSTDDNCTATGLIEYTLTLYEAPAFYVKGITMDTTSHTRMIAASEAAGYLGGIMDGAVFNTKFFNVTELGSQYYKCEPKMISATDTRLNLAVNGIGADKIGQVEYVRFSFDNNVGDNLFISYEPIE